MTDARPKRGAPWGLLILGVLTMGGTTAYLLKPPEPLEVEVLPIERGEVKELVPSASAGEVRGAQRVVVRAELAGTVEKIDFAAGARVEAGQEVLRFASKELNARMNQARANVDAARVAVRIAKTRQASSKRAHARAQKLRAKEAISAMELERTEVEVEAAGHGVSQAEATVRQVQAALRLAEVAVGRTKARAPFAGVIQKVFVDLGVQVAPGLALFDLIDDSALFVDVPVDEADISRVFMGQTAILRVGRKRLLGQVDFIPPAAGRAQEAGPMRARDRAFYVRVSLKDRDASLKVGISANAEFLVTAKKDVLFVPTHAVIGSGSRRSVFVVRKGRARKIEFEPGLTSWERTEIKSGLSQEDQVISSLNLRGLEDRARVKIKAAP